MIEEPRTKLGEALQKYWPLQDVVVTCDECGDELFNLTRDIPVEYSPAGFEILIKRRISLHRDVYGHNSVTVDIERKEVVKPIDVNITVETND